MKKLYIIGEGSIQKDDTYKGDFQEEKEDEGKSMLVQTPEGVRKNPRTAEYSEKFKFEKEMRRVSCAMTHINAPELCCSEQLQYLHYLEANPGTSIMERLKHEANILLSHRRQPYYIASQP